MSDSSPDIHISTYIKKNIHKRITMKYVTSSKTIITFLLIRHKVQKIFSPATIYNHYREIESSIHKKKIFC